MSHYNHLTNFEQRYTYHESRDWEDLFNTKTLPPGTEEFYIIEYTRYGSDHKYNVCNPNTYEICRWMNPTKAEKYAKDNFGSDRQFSNGHPYYQVTSWRVLRVVRSVAVYTEDHSFGETDWTKKIEDEERQQLAALQSKYGRSTD